MTNLLSSINWYAVEGDHSVSIWIWSSGSSLHMPTVVELLLESMGKWRSCGPVACDSCAREELLLACIREKKQSFGEVCMCTFLTKLQFVCITYALRIPNTNCIG